MRFFNKEDKDRLSEETQEIDERKKSGKRGHLRRNWYYYVGSVVVTLVVLLIVLFMVIIPAIVQNVVSDNPLPIYSASLTNPTPDSITFSLNSSIDTPSKITTKLMPLPLSLAGEDNDTPFATIVLPQTNLRGKTPIVIENQEAKILDMASFMSFLKGAMYSKSFTITATGKTDTYLGLIKAPIKLHKEITLPGLQNLTGFEVIDPELSLEPKEDGSNLVGTAVIPNNSPFSLEIGNLTLSLVVENFTIGSAIIDNLVLAPGKTTRPMRATVNMLELMKNMDSIREAQPLLLFEGLVIKAIGQKTTFNGHRITYYEEVLKNMVLTSTIDAYAIRRAMGFPPLPKDT